MSDAVRDHLDREELLVGRIELREPATEVLTISELALLLRLDEQQVEQAAVRGELPGRLVGGQWRFSRAAVLAWLGPPPRPD